MILRRHKNKLIAYGGIWSGTARDFISELSALERDYTDIDVHLHTYGGNVFEGNLMYNALNTSPVNITLIIDGVAASMGGILTLSRPNVKIVENGFLMYHAPRSYVSGTAQDFENNAKLLRSMEQNFKTKLKQRTGKSDKEIDKFMTGDNWFSAKEALELGLVSEIIEAKTDTIMPVENPAALGEKDTFNMYASLLTSVNKIENATNKNDKYMKAKLITELDLALTASASDTEVLDAVQAKFDELKQAKEDAEQNYKGIVSSIVEQAVKDRKIGETDKEVYMSIGLKAGVSALHKVLGKTNEVPAPNFQAQVNQGSGTNTDNRADWDLDKWQEEDPRGLEQMADKEPEKFKKLLNQKYK